MYSHVVAIVVLVGTHVTYMCTVGCVRERQVAGGRAVITPLVESHARRFQGRAKH